MALPFLAVGVVFVPLGHFFWWICAGLLALDLCFLVSIGLVSRRGVRPLEQAISNYTWREPQTTSIITTARPIRTWMAENAIEERPGRRARRSDLAGLIVRPSGIRILVNDHGTVRDLLVISKDAIADIREVSPTTSTASDPLLRITFGTGAAPLDLDLDVPRVADTLMPFERSAAVGSRSMRRVLGLQS